MWELFVAVGIAVAVAGLGVLARLPWESALGLGQLLVAGGLVLGVPAGALYHLLLARALWRRSALPRGWYWRPLSLHGALLPEERPWVLAWCGAGALGFFVIMLGLLVMGVPMAAAVLRS